MKKTFNPGEQVTLRRRIEAAEKAARIASIEKETATNAAVLAAAAAARAEEALGKADPKATSYNDIVADYNDAKTKATAAVEAENRALAAADRAEAGLAACIAAAKAAFAI